MTRRLTRRLSEADEGAEGAVARFEIADPDEMHAFGVALGRQLCAGDLLLLTGPLGAGKTTLTRGLGEGLGVRGPVTSPTFVLARTHPSLVGGPTLTHVDAYRLTGAEELDDLDLDFERSVVVAEWGAGLALERGSWLEVVIERPTGGGDAGGGDPEGDAGRAGAGGDETDDAEDWAEAPVETRIVSCYGHGDRWAEGVRV